MKNIVLIIVICIVLVVTPIILLAGPEKLKRNFSSFVAEGYGSDWLVIQYSQNGDVINYWELKNCSIGNNSRSDGINFIYDGNVVNISGHYIYIQIKDNFDGVKNKYLTKIIERKHE